MSLKRPSTNNLKSNISNKQSTALNKTKNKIWIIGSIFAVLLLIIAVFQFIGGDMNNSEQKKMEVYLEKKYGKKFAVNRVEDNSAGLGSKAYKANAYPLDDKNTTFEVTHSVGSSRYGDMYLWTLWTKQNGPKIAQDISSLEGKSETLDISVSIGPDREFINNNEERTPTLEDAIPLSNKNINLSVKLTERTSYNTDIAYKNALFIQKIIEKFSSEKAFLLTVNYVGKFGVGNKVYSGYLGSNYISKVSAEGVKSYELLTYTTPEDLKEENQ